MRNENRDTKQKGPIHPTDKRKEHIASETQDVSKIIPGITSDQLDSIMNLHGADITAKVNEITTLKPRKPP